ncbi:MAG: DUF2156 domain-containing protein [Corynebacterium glucuronolyticum]|nr:DUF2156 domain-containing protein [Corynebacterium glucuronolyticum]
MRRAQFLCKTLAHAASGAPVTWTLVALGWILFAVCTRTDTLGALSLDIPINALDILTSGLTFSTLPSGIAATVLALTGATYTERKLGSTWYAAVILVIQLVGGLSGAFIAWAVVNPLTPWGIELRGQELLTPFMWIVGASAMGSARFTILWRRRVRTLIVASVITVVLYSGTLTQLCVAVAAFVGLGLGIVLWNRPIRFARPTVSLAEARVLVGLMVAGIGLGPLIAALSPYSAGVLSGLGKLTDLAALCSQFDSLGNCVSEDSVNSVAMTILPAIIMLILVFGLFRGRRLAWWGTVITFLFTLPVVIIEASIFHALPEDPAWFFSVSVTSVAVPWILGFLVLATTARLFRVKGGELLFARILLFDALLAALLWFLLGGVGRWSALPLVYLPPMLREIVLGSTPSWRFVLASSVFWIIFAAGLWWALRRPPRLPHDSDRARALAFLDSGVGDHLSHMTLWPGNEYFFTDDGYVAYQVHNLVAVTVGSPVSAHPERLADAFQDHCRRQGLKCAWYSVPTAFAETRPGARVQVAEESIIDVSDVSFRGKKFQDVRTATNRAVKEHIRSVWGRWDDFDPLTHQRIRALSEEWVSEKSLPEMGFTLGGVDSLADPRVRLMVALDDAGRVHGVTSWLPAPGGWVLDLMRRDTEGFRSVVEFLIAETARRAHSDGLSWISLSGAPLAHSSVEGESSAVDGVLEKMGALLEPWYGFRSLAAFKRKFQPVHEKWWLCYGDVADLPAVGLAVTNCYVDVWDVARVALHRK